MNKKPIIIAGLIIIATGFVLGPASPVFAGENYNSSRSNTSTAIDDEGLLTDDEIAQVLKGLPVTINAMGIEEITIDEDLVRQRLIEFGISKEGVRRIFIKTRRYAFRVRLELPNAGLTPNSPFYFLEIAVEAIEEFLTFNTEAKARFQAKKSLERMAEIVVMLAEKDVSPKGLDVAFSRLQANVAKAAGIVQSQQQKGEDVSVLAKELDTNFELQRRALKQILENKDDQLELAFKQQKLKLKKQLLEVKLAVDAQRVGEIVRALDKLEQEKDAQEFLLKQQAEEMELVFEIEEKKFELALEEKERKLELREREAEFAFEQKKRELKSQFEEAERALELKEEALEDQFDIAISLGDIQDIDSIKAQLLAIGSEELSLDSKFDESRLALKEVERNFELLLLKEERQLEDFVSQEELTLKKLEFETEKAFKEKEFALELQFEAQEGQLEIQEKQLKLQILEARQACQQEVDPAACITEKVEPLQEKLAQVKIQKKQLEQTREGAERKSKGIGDIGIKVEEATGIEIAIEKVESTTKEVQEQAEEKPIIKPDEEPIIKPDEEPSIKPDEEPSIKPDEEPSIKPDEEPKE